MAHGRAVQKEVRPGCAAIHQLPSTLATGDPQSHCESTRLPAAMGGSKAQQNERSSQQQAPAAQAGGLQVLVGQSRQALLEFAGVGLSACVCAA